MEISAKWDLARAKVSAGRLSVIVPESAAEAVRGVFAAHGVGVETVALDSSKYPEAGAALRDACERAHGEFALVLEGDAAANAEQTPVFLETQILNSADVVIGSKRHGLSQVEYPWHRRLASWCYFLWVRWFLGLKVTEAQSVMKLFRRSVLADALGRMLVKANAFDLELLAIANSRGAKIVEAPVTLAAASRFGKIGAKTLRSTLWNSLAVFYRLRVLGYYANALVAKKLDHNPKVSVVIACPRRSWMLDECLKALSRQTYGDWEVIVLPDAAEDLSDLGLGDRAKVIVTGKVRPAEKRNLGIAAAAGEIVAFIDDDAYPDAHWLEYAVRYFGEETIGAVGGPGVTPPGDKSFARIGGRVYDNFLVSGNYRYRYRAGGVRMDVEDYPSCNLFVRTALLKKIGGYRTDFWPGEDTLLCKDILDNWQRIVYDPWIVVYHHRRPLFLPHLRQLGRYAFHRGYFCKRFPSNSLRLSYFVPSAFVAGFAVSPWIWPLYAFYGALVLATTFAVNPWTWLMTALGVVASHCCYGVRFIQGLCARKAPCEYIGKDHA